MLSAALRPFDELGELVEARWRAADYDEHRLPEIADATLDELRIPGRVDPWQALRELHAGAFPAQHDVEGRFSDLPLTVYGGPRFNVDLYWWLDGSTEIHQHSFSGAFQVLLGSSLHSRYAFTREREVNPRFLAGRLHLQQVEILSVGSTRPIVAGPETVHSLFHLDRPSVTLTVRSHHAPAAAPQYSYLKPSFAFDPFYREAALAKKIQGAALLLKMRHPEADAIIAGMLADADFQTAFHVLEVAAHHLLEGTLASALGLTAGADRLERLLDGAQERHGAIVDLVLPVITERRRQAEIVRRRSAITGEDHRFLLALFLNVAGREEVLRLVGERYPGADPVETVLDRVEELAATRSLGAAENVLGITGWDDDHVVVLECLLRGMEPEAMAAEIARRLPPGPAAALQARSAALAHTLRQAAVFSATLE